MAQDDLFNLYMANSLSVANYCGTFQISTAASTLTYTPGGICTRGGAQSSPQILDITLTGSSFVSRAGTSIIVGSNIYTGVSGSYDGSAWQLSFTQGGADSQPFTTLGQMAFPYGVYIFTLYADGPRASQVNPLGGVMTLLKSKETGLDSVQINVGGFPGIATVSPHSNKLNFGQVAPGPSVTVNKVIYNFHQLRYAFTNVDGRAVLWGRVQVSSSPAFSFVAVQWPALAMPDVVWIVTKNIGKPPIPLIAGSLDFYQGTFTPTGGKASPISPPTPLFGFTDTSTTPPTRYTGMVQLTVKGSGNSHDPVSHPQGLTWNFGGFLSSSQDPDPGEDGDWTSEARNGEIGSGNAKAHYA